MEPPWLVEARRLLGVAEVKGEGNDPVLRAMAEMIGLLNFEDDRDPWCTMFIAYCIKKALPEEPLPKHLIWSRAYAKWGIGLKEPVPGAVVVLWRGKDIKQDLGHAFFYTERGITESTMIGIGGNQKDKVSEDHFSRSRIVPNGIRWPSTYPLPEGAQVA